MKKLLLPALLLGAAWLVLSGDAEASAPRPDPEPDDPEGQRKVEDAEDRKRKEQQKKYGEDERTRQPSDELTAEERAAAQKAVDDYERSKDPLEEKNFGDVYGPTPNYEPKKDTTIKTPVKVVESNKKPPPPPIKKPIATNTTNTPVVKKVEIKDSPSEQQPVTPQPAGPTVPTGYDPVAARKDAAQLAAHLKKTGRSGYDRAWLRRWQVKAALKPDGIYGGATRGALIHYGVASPVQPFFAPFETAPYKPPR